ncbi:cytochrome P450 [Rhodococcus chondri]|uniref:Cytochrome P450 n=1 Tax=Rhodococcus chondri TaxID=3065941 RepID=A0ABU7JV37_9NOCA|nr:cytochrome P450 [Rhodococcus sp. CC-R104]MEE2033888.1 cytochrome P450 [Rhodococcus sp. CC-R104]
MSDFDSKDFFTDPSFIPDPHPFFDHHRSQCPVKRLEASQNVIAVTGFDECLEVLRNTAAFSNIVAPIGPFPGLPFEPQGTDISAQIDEHREQFPMFEHLVTMDPPRHSRHRRLLSGLFTPRRLEENEQFMWELADRQIDEFHSSGAVEMLNGYAQPFALLTVADLLGVPKEDHDEFRVYLNAQKVGAMEEGDRLTRNPLEFLDEKFTSYLEDRRSSPRGDSLTQLANAKFPDGSTPEIVELVRLATFLFAAGQDTTARLMTSAFRQIAEFPDLQKQLREDRTLIPQFVEEILRMEGPVKSDFRLARTATSLGDVEIPAGSVVMVSLPAANRDPRRFEDPHEFRMDRANSKEHVAFGRGVHSCPGAPLSRVEARVTIERMLDRMDDIAISETAHGPADDRRYTYEPTYILRGLIELHLEFNPVP